MVASRFNGMPQGPWRGGRFYEGAPPTIPHPLQLRENCLACHAGPASRPEIRTSHPERARCRQCHVPQS
jgi:nitrate reductase cytochrome c-type subunit